MSGTNKEFLEISVHTLQRLPLYLHYLSGLAAAGVLKVSAPETAEVMRLNEVQVRKDFAAVSRSRGKPKVGFIVNELIGSIKETLGYNTVSEAVLAGAGSLGKALLSYGGFGECGINIVAGFDTDKAVIGKTVCGKKVLPFESLGGYIAERKIRIGIIAVPAQDAQSVCDKMTGNGIEAIWNFAPVYLSVPEGILVKNENLASSLALLAKQYEELSKLKGSAR